MYGSSAWWGFTSAIDRQKVKAFIQHSTRTGFFQIQIMTFQNYVIKPITGCSTWFYSLNIMYWNNCCHLFSHRAITLANGRILSRQIPNRCYYLTDCNFLTRMLFADSYWWCFPLVLCLYYVCITLTFSISAFKLRFVNFQWTNIIIIITMTMQDASSNVDVMCYQSQMHAHCQSLLLSAVIFNALHITCFNVLLTSALTRSAEISMTVKLTMGCKNVFYK